METDLIATLRILPQYWVDQSRPPGYHPSMGTVLGRQVGNGSVVIGFGCEKDYLPLLCLPLYLSFSPRFLVIYAGCERCGLSLCPSPRFVHTFLVSMLRVL